MNFRHLFIFSIFLFSNFSFAVLEVKVIKSDIDALPIAVLPFNIKGDSELDEDIARIIRDDLNRSGRFRAFANRFILSAKEDVNRINYKKWTSNKIEALVIGSIENASKGNYKVTFRLFETYTKRQVYGKSWIVRKQSLRKMAHKISDIVYRELLDEKGAFDTHIAYITVKENSKGERKYSLEVADSDAQNPQIVLVSKEPILSPTWSPDGTKLAYVSFENGHSEVFIKYVWVRRKREKLPKFDGIASAPAWSPDGKLMALTLSKDGNKDIYIYDLSTKKLRRLTTHEDIDTEANFSPDSKKIIFTSNRSGKPNIYTIDISGGKAERLTYIGNYNAKPVYSPNGKYIALVHRQFSAYRIGLIDLENNTLSIMSSNALDESPYFAPNSSMIIYATNQGNKGILSVISIDGKRSHRLMSTIGEVREPTWSSF